MIQTKGCFYQTCHSRSREGVSNVGEAEIKWQKNDIFSLPRNHWISHRAAAKDSKLFQVTDRETLTVLHYLSEEFQE